MNKRRVVWRVLVAIWICAILWSGFVYVKKGWWSALLWMATCMVWIAVSALQRRWFDRAVKAWKQNAIGFELALSEHAMECDNCRFVQDDERALRILVPVKNGELIMLREERS